MASVRGYIFRVCDIHFRKALRGSVYRGDLVFLRRRGGMGRAVAGSLGGYRRPLLQDGGDDELRLETAREAVNGCSIFAISMTKLDIEEGTDVGRGT